MSNEILNKAIKFAVDAHANQKRKGTNIPYIVHPLETVAIVSTMTEDENILVAAVLHDVVEDTGFTVEDIKREFNETIAQYVKAESENKRENLPAENTWKIRKTETIEHLSIAPIEMKKIALGDKLSNIRAMYRDYNEIGDELWKRFNEKDKKQHGWYYKSICDTLEPELKGYEVYKEFKMLVSNLFN